MRKPSTKLLRIAMAALAITLAGEACGVAASPAGPVHNRLRTVFVIVLENHDWSDIKGNPSAPYINKTLLRSGSHADRYYNPPLIHPSLPNYLWMEAGTSFGIADDGLPSQHVIRSHNHLVRLLEKAGISWKAYQENISGRTCPVTSNALYAPKHDPFVYFTDVSGRAAYCRAHVRPFPELAHELQKNSVARYNFITPNLCNDMHDSCSPLNNRVKQGDRWLAQTVPGILSSRAYKNGGAIFITWDEARILDGPIGMIVLSPYVRGHGYFNHLRYTHSSLLRTLEAVFGVHPLLGDAARATDLRDLFSRFP